MKKRIFTILTIAALTFSLSACGTGSSTTEDTAGSSSISTELIGGDSSTWGPDLEEESEPSSQIATPFTEYDTQAEAEKQAGFAISLPESAEQASVFLVFDELHMLEVQYRNSEDELIASYRKEEGSNGDNSGVYDEFTDSAEMDVVSDVTGTSFTAQVRGNDGAYQVAVWEADGFTYSIYLSQGVYADEMQTLIQALS